MLWIWHGFKQHGLIGNGGISNYSKGLPVCKGIWIFFNGGKLQVMVSDNGDSLYFFWRKEQEIIWGMISATVFVEMRIWRVCNTLFLYAWDQIQGKSELFKKGHWLVW